MKCSFPEHQEVDEPTRKAPNLVAFKRNDCSKFRPTYLLAVSSSCKLLHVVYSGPEVRGTRPVLVTFENFKDRDEVLRKVSEQFPSKIDERAALMTS